MHPEAKCYKTPIDADLKHKYAIKAFQHVVDMTKCLIIALTLSRESFSPTPFLSLNFLSWRHWLSYRAVIFFLTVTVPRGKKYLPFHLSIFPLISRPSARQLLLQPPFYRWRGLGSDRSHNSSTATQPTQVEVKCPCHFFIYLVSPSPPMNWFLTLEKVQSQHLGAVRWHLRRRIPSSPKRYRQ